MKVTVQSFRDYLNCKRKLFLREQGETGEENDYARFIAESRERFCAQVVTFLCEKNKTDIIPNDADTAQRLRQTASDELVRQVINQARSHYHAICKQHEET